MASELSVVDQLRVASPCKASWDEMKGTDRVRFCSLCSLNVYDVSAMPRQEAEALIRTTEGRLCVRFYRRADGTVLTRDCPKGIRALRLRLARAASAILAMVVAVVAPGCEKAGRHTMGDVAVPPPTLHTMGERAAPPNPDATQGGGRLVMGETRPETR